MNANFDIPPDVLSEVMSQALFKGELGEKVADRLADLYAEITTYNRTDAAKLLNIGRNTLYDHEKAGRVTFRSDGRISLADLLEFQRRLADELADNDQEITRKTKREPRRLK